MECSMDAFIVEWGYGTLRSHLYLFYLSLCRKCDGVFGVRTFEGRPAVLQVSYLFQIFIAQREHEEAHVHSLQVHP